MGSSYKNKAYILTLIMSIFMAFVADKNETNNDITDTTQISWRHRVTLHAEDGSAASLPPHSLQYSMGNPRQLAMRWVSKSTSHLYADVFFEGDDGIAASTDLDY